MSLSYIIDSIVCFDNNTCEQMYNMSCDLYSKYRCTTV